VRVYQGVDLIEINRIRAAYDRQEAFGRDIYTEAELAYCTARPDPYPHLAGRFAAKEACLKAFGVGMGGFGATGRFREIEIEGNTVVASEVLREVADLFARAETEPDEGSDQEAAA